ncbi:MAG: Gfo/Idh/MocA family oxidoreductase [Acidobacteriaceae bacterium]|jgi:predicted dehydrogenase
MPDLKAAVIGTGGAARLHLESYARSPLTQPVAVVSHSPARAAALATEFSAGSAEPAIRPYTSIEQMLATERPDLVSVATLEWDHEAPVLLSLAAGAHVLCEKIMASTLASGERMLAAARAAHRTLAVNYNYRAVPTHALIKQALDGGDIGTPALFAAHMHAYLFPHWLDLMRYFFGDPTEVTATALDDQALRPPVSTGPSGRPWVYPTDDPSPMLYHPSIAASATFRFADPHSPEPAFLATLSASAFVPLEENFWSFALYGTRGSFAIDRATRANLNGTASLGPIAAQLAALPPCSYAESFSLSVAAFAEAVLHHRPAPVTGEDGLAALRLDAALVQSARTARTVAFAPK